MSDLAPVFVAQDIELEWPGHVFPAEKYGLLRRRLERELGVGTAAFTTAKPATQAQLLRVHSAEYLARVRRYRDEDPLAAIAEFEAPCTPAVFAAFLAMAGGSIRAGELALEQGLALNLGGGFHHAFADHGEGFCIFNDIAVSIRDLQARGLARRVAVIDCDLHQGNGTARIFQGDSEVFTFSIHEEDNYPIKEKSDWDIGLAGGTRDAAYLRLLGDAVDRILAEFRPELVHYVAGADPYAGDMLGGLALSIEGLAERDEIVLGKARAAGVSVVATLAGGYAERVEDVVAIHFNLARRIWRMARGVAG